EYDVGSKMIKHFDASIHFYNSKDYEIRSSREHHLGKNSRGATQIKGQSQKIFSVDSPMPVDMWVELSSLFLHANPLIHEYFNGKYPDSTAQHLTRLSESNDKN